jgi:hypothetical protein
MAGWALPAGFFAPPTIYDVVTVSGVLLTVGLLLYERYLDNAAPLKLKLEYYGGGRRAVVKLGTYIHFTADGKNRGRVPRFVGFRIEPKPGPDTVHLPYPGSTAPTFERPMMIHPHEEFSQIVDVVAARPGKQLLRLVCQEQGRWIRTHSSGWVEIEVSSERGRTLLDRLHEYGAIPSEPGSSDARLHEAEG